MIKIHLNHFDKYIFVRHIEPLFDVRLFRLEPHLSNKTMKYFNGTGISSDINKSK